MSAVMISVAEVLLVGFTVWALFHEEYFAQKEERLFSYIRRRSLKVVKGRKKADKHCA